MNQLIRLVPCNFRRLGPVLLATIMALALIDGVGSGPVIAAGGGATVTFLDHCGILLPGILPEGGVVDATGFLEISPSGTATLKCTGQTDFRPAETILFRDIPCALGEGGQVGESHTMLTPDGKATLICHNNPGSEPFDPGPGD